MSALPALATEDTRLGLIFDTLGPAPKTNRGKRKLNAKCKKWICELMAIVPSRQLAATHLGITPQTINREARRDPEFMKAYKEAQEEGNANVASMVYEQAAGLGIVYEVVKEGSNAKLVAVPQERSEKMLELLFKLQHKEVFFTQTHNVKGEVQHSGVLSEFQATKDGLLIPGKYVELLPEEEQLQLMNTITKLADMAQGIGLPEDKQPAIEGKVIPSG